MTQPLDYSPFARASRWLSLTRWVACGFWLRVAAADAAQWLAKRRGDLCIFPDTKVYWALAGKIVRGGPYEMVDWGAVPHFTLRTPGYPLFLAACRALFGARAMPPRLIQAALGALCVWLVARLVEQALPETCRNPLRSVWTVSLIAAAIAAVDPFIVANSAFLLSEALFLPLMLVAQLGMAALWSKPAWDRSALGWALGVGVASGAAVLVRPSWALYPPLLGSIWLTACLAQRRSALRGLAFRSTLVMALGLVLVMAPWWVRNARIYGKFVPTAMWMGASLYDGLSPSATGASRMDFLAEPEFWPLDEEAQDARLRDQALAFARANPGRVVELAAIKAWRFWSPWPNAESFRSTPLAVASVLITLPQFALLAIGLWDRRRDARALILLGLPLIYTFLLHLIFVSSMRYRIPVIVPALGFVAIGLARVWPTVLATIPTRSASEGSSIKTPR
jgi:4-amino-4-deoxy-L-arabinose transferase-like glycosyltransferase